MSVESTSTKNKTETKTNSSGDKPPKHLQKKIKHDPRYYMLNFWRHPNDATRNYDFETDEGKPLLYLTDKKSPLNPRNWGNINVLLFARGCLKTTGLVGISNWVLDMYPQTEISMTAPVEDQTNEFSDRFKEKVEESGIIEKRVKNNVSHQKFEGKIKDEKGQEHTVYSDLKIRSSYGEGDRLRGLHSHLGIVDEFQDVDEGTFSVFLEAIDQQVPSVGYFPAIFIIGTPKMKTSFFHDLWNLSDKKTWKQKQKEWIEQEESESYGFGDSEYTVKGWHIDQPNCPLHNEGSIQFKKRTYSERKFRNEVLAQFYSPEDDLLTDVDIRSIVNFENEPKRRRSETDTTISIGVDWGGGKGEDASDTVIVIGEDYSESKVDNYWGENIVDFVIHDVKFIDHDVGKRGELEKLEEFIMKYDADQVVVDEGYGSTRREDLQNGDGTFRGDGYDMVYGCIYGNIKNKEEVKWNDKDDKKFFTCNRTHMIESLVEDIKRGKIMIEGKGLDLKKPRTKGSKLENQLTAPYKEKKETPSGKKKLKVMSDRKDDAMHSLVYSWIGAYKLGSRRTLTRITTSNRKGY